MKKFVAVAIVFIIIWSASLPSSAQKLEGLNLNALSIKNQIRYASADAYSDGRGVWLEWKTAFETKNIGFYVYRINGGEKELVSRGITPGAYLQLGEKAETFGSYSLYDPSGDVNSTYVIESLNLSGQKQLSKEIKTKLVEDLKPIAGFSSEQLQDQARNATQGKTENVSILPQELEEEARASAAQADLIKQQWVAAQPGARIGVKAEGFYRVSRAALQAAGFDVTAPTVRWQLYVNGVQQAINVPNDGAYIEFYGKGVDTIASDTQIYFLVVGPDNGKRILTTSRRQLGGQTLSESYFQSFIKKDRTFYTQNIFNGDAENVFGTLTDTTSPFAVSFNLSGVDFSSPTSSLDITVQGIVATAQQVKIVINNVDVGTITGNGIVSISQHLDFPTSVLKEGANSLQMFALNGIPGSCALDTFKINFARRYKADQNKISFYVPNYKANYIEGFSSANIRVFDITNQDAPVLINNLPIEQASGSYRVFLPANRGRILFAVEDSGLSQPVSVTQNSPSTLSTVSNNGEMVIITHKNFLAEAENWAIYRRSQGTTVKVVDVEDVYDEFNYGVKYPDAIRTFLQYAKSNWQTPPNYVLLIGDATFDPKNYFAFSSSAEFVPTRFVDTLYTEAPSDETLADFNNDGLAEIAIGRIPARDIATVALMLNRVMAYEQKLATESGFSRGVLFASDLPEGYDFEGVNNRLCALISSQTTCTKVNRGQTNANGLLVDAMNSGKFVVNYAGHGNLTVWANTGFFSNSHAATLTNSNKLSIFTLLTCLNGYFVNPTDVMSEVLLKNPNGGAVSAWASTGLTTPDIQETMATRFYSQMATGNITRLGDLIKDAKTVITSGRDVRLSWALLGDPMTKVK